MGAAWNALFGRQTLRPFPVERLTVRILADVDDVDPRDDSSQRSETASVRLVAKEFLPRISAQLCLEEDDGSLEWLTESNVEAWGLSYDHLFGIAIANLNRQSATAKLHKANSDDGSVYSPLCDGVLLSSLIFAGTLFRDFKFDRGDLIAAIPNRYSLFFCKRSSSASISLLQTLSGLAWNDEDCPRKYRITQSLLVPDATTSFGWALLQNQNWRGDDDAD